MSQPFLSSLRLISILTVIYSLTTDAFDFIKSRADNSQVECAGFSNPQFTPFTYSNEVCYMKEVTIECGWIIDHQGGPITTDNNNTVDLNNCPNALWLAKIQNGKLAAQIAPQQQKSPDYRKLWKYPAPYGLNLNELVSPGAIVYFLLIFGLFAPLLTSSLMTTPMRLRTVRISKDDQFR